MSGDSTPAQGPAQGPTPPERIDPALLGPALLDGPGLEGEAMRAAVRQQLFGASEPLRIDRFVVERRLGAGGMGVVFLAHDPSLGRKVAIKLLHAEGARRATAHARLQREARALASLSHPHVVAVYEVGVHEGQLYLVMEHVAGQTLREWTRAHASDWRMIIAQYRAAGEGLAAAHRAGIIHRDFKPDNVLVDEDGRPRVLDFGLAASSAEPSAHEASWEELGDLDLTKTGAIMGTPGYMAPEQFLGTTVDARTDQFSFCVALWEALFGRRPFGGDDLLELRRRVLAGRRRAWPSRTPVPRSILTALARGLATDPADRFATMPELLRALAEPRPPGPRAWIVVVALGGLAAAAVLARDPAPTEAPPATSPPPDLVATETAEPEPPAAPERPVLPTRRLTHTTGYGVRWASVGARTQTIVYGTLDSEPLWMIPESSVDAEPTVLPVPGSSFAHVAHEGGYWVVELDTIRRVQPDGATDRIIDRGKNETRVPSRNWMSPDGTSIAIDGISTLELWDLRGTRAEPVLLSIGSSVWGVGWSPDASQIATVVTLGRTSHRVDVFGTDGGLQLSTPWPETIGGRPLRGLGWLPSGLVVLVSDEHEAWVQCLGLTEAGVTPGPRSAGMELSTHAELVGVTADRRLVVAWPEVRWQVVVLELSDDGRWEGGALPGDFEGWSNPVWLSETELAFLANDPPRSLVKMSIDDPSHHDVLAAGAFHYAASDGEGGVVLWSEGGAFHHLPRGATDLRLLRLPGIGSSRPSLRCRSPRDCLLSSSTMGKVVLYGVDLERQHVRRRFECPAGVRCDADSWDHARDGRELRLVDEQERRLVSIDAETGRLLEAQPPPLSWSIVQSVTQSPSGELLLTGIRMSEPPEGTDEDLAKGPYLVLRLDDDGEYRPVWSHEQGWVTRPRLSPSGRRLALEGFIFHADLVELELGSLCAGP